MVSDPLGAWSAIQPDHTKPSARLKDVEDRNATVETRLSESSVRVSELAKREAGTLNQIHEGRQGHLLEARQWCLNYLDVEAAAATRQAALKDEDEGSERAGLQVDISRLVHFQCPLSVPTFSAPAIMLPPSHLTSILIPTPFNT